MKRRSLLYEPIVEQLKSEIVAGRLQPGDRLPAISEMAAMHQVSPASVREAYRALSSEGLVEVVQGSGTFVAAHAPTRGAALRQFQLAERTSRAHLLEARKTLEPTVAAFAALRATDAEARAIEDHAKQTEVDFPTADEWLDLNLHFHDLVLTAAHNPVLAQMLAAVSDLIRDVHPMSPQTDDDRRLAIEHHNLIALAIRQKNPDAARAFMHQHIETFEEEAVRSRDRELDRSRP